MKRTNLFVAIALSSAIVLQSCLCLDFKSGCEIYIGNLQTTEHLPFERLLNSRGHIEEKFDAESKIWTVMEKYQDHVDRAEIARRLESVYPFLWTDAEKIRIRPSGVHSTSGEFAFWFDVRAEYSGTTMGGPAHINDLRRLLHLSDFDQKENIGVKDGH